MNKVRTLRFLARVLLSAAAGLTGFAVVVLTVSALVSLTYPHNDKALGLYAMLYGLTVGLPLGALAFSAAFRTLQGLDVPPIDHEPHKLIG
ncbi:MAG TPA: hypothetical protein VEG30_00140 [Terriglobales bacterium]|nr:hypothetical protein [Terriglobales bacterium]